MITLDTLKEVLDQHFSEPFLKSGTVTTKFVEGGKKRELQIKIGRRDVWLDEDGQITGAGTAMLESSSI